MGNDGVKWEMMGVKREMWKVTTEINGVRGG